MTLKNGPTARREAAVYGTGIGKGLFWGFVVGVIVGAVAMLIIA